MRKHAGRCGSMLMVVVAALLLVSAGCGGASSRTSGNPTSSGSPTTPGGPTTPPAAGQLSANPASIAFGNVTVNTSATQTVQLNNSGGSAVTLSSASTSGPGFHLTGLSLPLTLSSGQSTTFSAIFNPSSAGAATGSVQVTAAGVTSPVTIALSGTAVTAVPGSAPHEAALSWLPSTSAVVGYNVYRGNQSGGPYAQTNSTLVGGTAFTDSSVVAGQTYWYVVTAVAPGGIESVHSNEAMAAIPTP